MTRRRLRGVRVVLGLIVAATLVDLAPTTARAQDAEPVQLAGYQGSAAASGLHAFYNPEGLLPLPPPVDIGAPDALATIASGPATFARASVLDPGDLLNSPEALLALASSDYPGGIIPAYPFRIAATSGIGEPTLESNPAPGLHARVAVDEGTAEARATLPAVNAPAVVRFGSMLAEATTNTDGSTVTVHAYSEVSDIRVLDVLRIGTLVTDLYATSSGGETELSGGTTISGASIMGQPVVIDADGIRTPGGDQPLLGGVLGALLGPLDELLGRLGITVSVAAPIEQTGGGTGELATNGLRIGVELSPDTLPGLAALIDALPPLENPLPGAPSIEDLLAVASARHLVAVDIGRGVVSLLARPAQAGPPGTTPSLPGSSGIGLPSTTPSFSIPGTSGPASAPPTDVPSEGAGAATMPEGVGVGALVLLALLAVPFIGDRIARISTAVLATDRSTTCTWEER